MEYEIIETVGFDGVAVSHVIVNLGNGEFKSFPVDEGNPEYVALTASTEEEE
jgi:hypothetical protein